MCILGVYSLYDSVSIYTSIPNSDTDRQQVVCLGRAVHYILRDLALPRRELTRLLYIGTVPGTQLSRVGKTYQTITATQ